MNDDLTTAIRARIVRLRKCMDRERIPNEELQRTIEVLEECVKEAPAPVPAGTPPPGYMLAKLQMVMPLFQEARDTLTVVTEPQRRMYGIRLDLVDRMDKARTFSLDDWLAAAPKGEKE